MGLDHLQQDNQDMGVLTSVQLLHLVQCSAYQAFEY